MPNSEMSEERFMGVDLASGPDRTIVMCPCGYMCPLDEIDIPGMHACTFITAKQWDKQIAKLKIAQANGLGEG